MCAGAGGARGAEKRPTRHVISQRAPHLIEPVLNQRVELPLALMLAGMVVGGTSVGWWIVIGNAPAAYASLLVGHVAILVGFALRRSRRRLLAVVLLSLLMWWPAVFGDLIWA